MNSNLHKIHEFYYFSLLRILFHPYVFLNFANTKQTMPIVYNDLNCHD